MNKYSFLPEGIIKWHSINTNLIHSRTFTIITIIIRSILFKILNQNINSSLKDNKNVTKVFYTLLLSQKTILNLIDRAVVKIKNLKRNEIKALHFLPLWFIWIRLYLWIKLGHCHAWTPVKENTDCFHLDEKYTTLRQYFVHFGSMVLQSLPEGAKP